MTNCPQCGGTHLDRDAVDIGVGTQYGPWHCLDCGWREETPQFFDLLDEGADDDLEAWLGDRI